MYTERTHEMNAESALGLEETEQHPRRASTRARTPNGDLFPRSTEGHPELVETPSGWAVAAGIPGLLANALANLTLGRPKGEGERRLNLHAPQMLVMLSDIATMAETPDDAVERLRLIAKMARETVAQATGVTAPTSSNAVDS
jgi:hypothetical protein